MRRITIPETGEIGVVFTPEEASTYGQYLMDKTTFVESPPIKTAMGMNSYMSEILWHWLKLGHEDLLEPVVLDAPPVPSTPVEVIEVNWS
jgi:hypothetical protein